MIIYILFSFAVGLQGGVFELKGDDIVYSSYGSSFGVFADLSVTPNLNYSLSFVGGKAEAFSNTVARDSSMMPMVFVREYFQYFKTNLSVNWCPFQASFFPYLSGRLGLNQWKLLDANGDVAESLSGSDYEGLSLSLGGGGGIKAKVTGFVVSVEGYSDFIFSENKDWHEGFGGYDDNEWTFNIMFKLGRKF